MTRCCISAAAFLVKVMQRISSGRWAWANSLSTRWVSSSVLPEPAGARTAKDCWGSKACWRCWKSSGCLFVMMFFCDWFLN